MNFADVLLDELAQDPAALERLREMIGVEVVGVADGPHVESWVGVKVAAEHLGCKPQRIYDLVSDRAIPFRKDGSRLLFRLSELDDWLGGSRPASRGV